VKFLLYYGINETMWHCKMAPEEGSLSRPTYQLSSTTMGWEFHPAEVSILDFSKI
jgi:hypothetical protein